MTRIHNLWHQTETVVVNGLCNQAIMINWRGAQRNRWTNKRWKTKRKTEVRFALSSFFARTVLQIGDLTSSPWNDRDEGPGKTTEKQNNNKKKNLSGGGFQRTKQHLFPPPQNQIGAWFCSTLVLPSVQFYGFVYCICRGAPRRILKGYPPARRAGTYTCGYAAAAAATLEIIIGRNPGPGH